MLQSTGIHQLLTQEEEEEDEEGGEGGGEEKEDRRKRRRRRIRKWRSLWSSLGIWRCASLANKGREGMSYLTTLSTHFIYGYMASDIW